MNHKWNRESLESKRCSLLQDDSSHAGSSPADPACRRAWVSLRVLGLPTWVRWGRLSPATWVERGWRCWHSTFSCQRCPSRVVISGSGTAACEYPAFQLPLPSGALRACNSLWNKAWPAHHYRKRLHVWVTLPHALCK